MKKTQAWSAEEEKSLEELVKNRSERISWIEVADSLNSQYPSKLRFPKQCRQRFINYSNKIKKQNTPVIWTPGQTDLLFSLYRQMGSKWTEISKKFEGKSENCVKNKFYGTLRRTVRCLNSIFRQSCHKSKKQIPFKSVMKVFQYAEGKYRIQKELYTLSQEIRGKILQEAAQQSIGLEIQEIEKLMKLINQFNFTIRSFKARKKNQISHLENKDASQHNSESIEEEKLNEGKILQSVRVDEYWEQMQLLGSVMKQNQKKRDQILFKKELKQQHQEKENFFQVEFIDLDEINWEKKKIYLQNDDSLFQQAHSPYFLPSQPSFFI